MPEKKYIINEDLKKLDDLLNEENSFVLNIHVIDREGNYSRLDLEKLFEDKPLETGELVKLIYLDGRMKDFTQFNIAVGDENNIYQDSVIIRR